MLRAIVIAFLVVVLCFGIVVLQFVPRRGVRAAPAGPAPLLETREDGSVYAVSLEISQLERRLIDNEERSRRLTQDLAAARKQRDDLQAHVDELQDQVDALRRQINQRRAPAPAPAPGPNVNGPASIPPNPNPGGGSPAPVTPVPPPGQ